MESEKEKEWHAAFCLFDINGDGKISMEELSIGMRKLGHFPSQREVETMLAENDLDGDGNLDFNEFMYLMDSSDNPGEDDRDEARALYLAFRMFDKSGSGFISATDIQALFERIGIEVTIYEVDQMMDEVDLDGDGRIDFEEFCVYLESNDNDIL